MGGRGRSGRLAVALSGAAIALAACGPATTASTGGVAATSQTAAVGSGAACIPDINTSHVAAVVGARGDATGISGSGVSAQQVRDGTAPPPPEATLVTSGDVALPSGATAGGARPTVAVYASDCGPSDVRAFYVAALLQDQWVGDFTLASDLGSVATTVAAPPVRSGLDVRLFDVADLMVGRFVNVHPSGDAAAYITILPAIEAPGTSLERHPTYVQVVSEPWPSTSATRPLSPTVATTPNTGASGGPPGQ